MEHLFAEEIARFLKYAEALRSVAELTQDEIASYAGMSRQTYSTIITTQKISWRNFLCLLFCYDANPKTKDFLRILKVFPERFVTYMNEKKE